MRPISQTLKTLLSSVYGNEVAILVKVNWADGTIIYSEQEFLFDRATGQYTFPALLKINEFSAAKKITGNGTIDSCGIVLDDSDGHLKERLNNQNLHGVLCEIFLHINGLEKHEALKVMVGKIAGDSIVWGAKDKVLNFTIESITNSNDVGFKAWQGMLPSAHKEFHELPWNMGFGAPKGVQFLQYNRTPQALCGFTLKYKGPSAFDDKAYILSDMQGFELDTTYTIDFLDPTDLFTPINGSPITGKVYNFENNSYIFIPDGMNPEVTPLPVLTARDSSDTAHFNDFRFWWIDIDSGTDDLTGMWLNFNDIDNRPLLNATKIISHVGYRIELSHQPRWGVKTFERDPLGNANYKKWYSNFSVFANGTMQTDLEIIGMAENVHFGWDTRALQFYEVTNIAPTITSVAKNKTLTEDDDPTLREYYRRQPSPGNPSVSVTKTVDPIDPNLYHYVTTFLPENKDKIVQSAMTYGWRFVDAYKNSSDRKSGFERNVKKFNGTGGEKEAVIVQYGATVSKYIANLFPSAPEDDDEIVMSIGYESRNSRAKLLPIDMANVTVSNLALIPEEDIESTIVEITPSVELDPAGRRTGDVFGNLTTSYRLPDGRGSTVPVDSSNAAEVIAWLFNTYTKLKVATNDQGFTAIREKVANFPMNFVVTEPIDAIVLAEIIAWEHKIALVTFGNEVRLVYLNEDPTSSYTFDSTNTELRSVELSYTPQSEIITQFRFKYKEYKNDTEPTIVIGFNNNVIRYGERQQDIDVTSLDNKEAVLDLVKFWGNRLSRAWRQVTFSARLDAIVLQPFDAVTINIPKVSPNSLTAYIDEIRLDPDNYRVQIKCTIASELGVTNQLGEIVEDGSYWRGIENLEIKTDTRVAIIDQVDGVYKRRFTETEQNTIKPFKRHI